MYPASGHSGIFQVLNIRQSTVSDEIRDTQKFDNSVDRKLSNDGDSTSIFSKVIGGELSHSSIAYLYLRCWMDFASNTVRTKAPHFVDLGLPAVNALDEFNIFVTPANRIRNLTDGSHGSAPDHVFGKATAVGMNATISKLGYSYKTDFQNWRKNQDFEHQNIPMIQPPLD